MLVVLLASVTASFVVAVLLSAAAFAIVHYPQGAKSMGWVFAIGLVMQAVVSATGTLYVAMGVHAVYDVTAALRRLRAVGAEEAEGLDGESAQAARRAARKAREMTRRILKRRASGAPDCRIRTALLAPLFYARFLAHV